MFVLPVYGSCVCFVCFVCLIVFFCFFCCACLCVFDDFCVCQIWWCICYGDVAFMCVVLLCFGLMCRVFSCCMCV